MNFEEYQKNAIRTMANLPSGMDDHVHMALGMCTEISELMQAIQANNKVNIGEEIADIHWYNANEHTLLQLEYKEPEEGFAVLSTDKEFKMLIFYIAEYQDGIKKLMAYGRPFDEFKRIELLNKITIQLLRLAECFRLDTSTILQNNIDKLRVRYPEKFTEENANNRDTDAEYKELEKE